MARRQKTVDQSRRKLITSSAALAGGAAASSIMPLSSADAAPQSSVHTALPAQYSPDFGGRKVAFVLSHEQFPAPQLITFGVAAEQAGFDLLWTSDHFQPWQDNQGHAGQAWVTLSILGQATKNIPIGTGVTCPTFRYEPAVVAQAFSSLSQFYPGRIFLGIGTGEALNEQASGGGWGKYPERRDRFAESVSIIRQLWTGKWISFNGKYYDVGPAKLYDPPKQPIPLYMAASGEQSMRLSGQLGDGLITDTMSLMKQNLRAAHAEGVRSSGRNPANIPIGTEAFVVVGNEQDARQAAELWRFTPKAWTPDFLYDPDPRSIQRKADTQIPLEEVYKEWPVSTDPEPHVQNILKLWNAGATTVFIHSGQADQLKVIDFYGKEVLPRLRQGVTVPNVVGLSEADATARVQAAGLFVSYVDRQDKTKLGDLYDRTPAGVVVSSLPAGGAKATAGTGVTLGVRV